jgi:hypothetical protein
LITDSSSVDRPIHRVRKTSNYNRVEDAVNLCSVMLKKLVQLGFMALETILIPQYPMSGSSPSLLGLGQMEAKNAIGILKASETN